MHSQGFEDIGPSFGYVLRSVAAAPLTLTELAAGLRLTPQGAAKIVDEMVAQRYLKRQVDSADARARRLHLAPRGERALRTARAFHADFEQRFAQQHGIKRAKALRSALEALISDDAETLRTAPPTCSDHCRS